MYSRHFFGIISTVLLSISLPLFVSAQTATTTPVEVFDVQQYIRDMQEEAITSMDKQEREFINPLKIREKAIQDNLQISVNPPAPKAGGKVTVTVESNLTNLSKATITWTLNGVVTLRGIDKKVFSFTNGNAGETTRLTISIITNTGSPITRELSWRPVGVTLLWESDT